MFDLSLPKLLVLAVLAPVVFGPKELPKITAQAGRALEQEVHAESQQGFGPRWRAVFGSQCSQTSGSSAGMPGTALPWIS